MSATDKVILMYQRGLYETVADAVASRLLTTDAERETVREALTPVE